MKKLVCFVSLIALSAAGCRSEQSSKASSANVESSTAVQDRIVRQVRVPGHPELSGTYTITFRDGVAILNLAPNQGELYQSTLYPDVETPHGTSYREDGSNPYILRPTNSGFSLTVNDEIRIF